MNSIIVNRTPLNLVAIVALSFLSFIMSVIWHGAESVVWLTPLVSWLVGNVEAASLMTEPPSHYFFYGHFTLIFYGLIWVHLKALKPKINKNVFHLSLLLLSVAIVGDLFAYWLSEFYGVGMRRMGFWYMELPALVSLILFWFSLGLYLSVKQKRVNGIVWILPMALLSVAGIQYMPHSLLLVILIALSLKLLPAPNSFPAKKYYSSNHGARPVHEISG